MNMSVLAKKMLLWEELVIELNALTAEIEGAVLEIGKTQKVGNVSASYSGGRKTYDYNLAIAEALSDGRLDGPELDPFERISIDYRSACKELSIDAPFTKSEPKVMVKLLT